MDVHEARGHKETRNILSPLSLALPQIAHSYDTLTPHAHICQATGYAGAVYQ
jgi:hypothetical protein